MIQSLQNLFFGPLTKDACYIYLFFSISSLITFIILVFQELYLIFTDKKYNFYIFIKYKFAVMLSVFVSYFSSRLLFSVCKTSLQ